jgi:hypothetical protein
MSCNGPDRGLRFISALAIPPLLLLSACGGDGSYGVASTPPPPTPAPTPTPTPTPAAVDVKTSWLDSPATRNGNYTVIGRLTLDLGNGGPTTNRTVAPGEFTMSTGWYFGRDSGDLPNYSLGAATGTLPGGVSSIAVNGPFLSWSFNPPSSYANRPSGTYCCQMLGQQLTAYSIASDGSETQIVSNTFTRSATDRQPGGTNNNLQVHLDYDIGYSYVSMGEWAWSGPFPPGESSSLLFVSGELTPPSGIPASGTATYDARTLTLASGNSTLAIPFSLTADFGQRTMSTRIDQDYRYNSTADSMDFYPALGLHVSGSAPFSTSGTFNIPLNGTANYSVGYPTNPVTTPPPQPVTGIMNGAFFGPNAEQVGGVFSISGSGGAMQLQDAFVGQQHHP